MRQCCVWTSGGGQGVVCFMDDDTSDLVAQLCTRIGMAMEDASPVALTFAGMDPEARESALVELEVTIRQTNAMIAAARALQV